jgi:hypothetical protein
MLERCWSAITACAWKLYRTGEVRHDDVCAALGLPDAGGPSSFALALIRSGSTPGSFTVMRTAL